MSWPGAGVWGQNVPTAMTPDMMAMGSCTPEQWAAMQQQWQQWTQWQQQYAQWQSQYGEKYAEQMQAMQMSGAPPLPPAQPALPAPPPPDKPPPPPHENNQPLYGQQTPMPSAPVPAPVPPVHQNKMAQPAGMPTHNTPLKANHSAPVWDSKQNNQNDWNQNPNYGGWSGGGNNLSNVAGADSKGPPINWNDGKHYEGNRTAASAANTEALKKLSEEERLFDIQFQKWEEEFEKWKQQNLNHPDKQAYREYEQKFEACRAQLLERRQQMIQKRMGLMNNQATNSSFSAIAPPKLPPAGVQNNNQIQKAPLLNLPSTMMNTIQRNKQPQHDFPQNQNTYRNSMTKNTYTDSYESYHDEYPNESYSKMNESYNNKNNDIQSNSNSNFLSSNEARKGIPGLDLVPEEDLAMKLRAKEASEVIEVPDEQGQASLKDQHDFSAISKGINNILGDETILNILSMVRGQKFPPGLNANNQDPARSLPYDLDRSGPNQSLTKVSNTPYNPVGNNFSIQNNAANPPTWQSNSNAANYNASVRGPQGQNNNQNVNQGPRFIQQNEPSLVGQQRPPFQNQMQNQNIPQFNDRQNQFQSRRDGNARYGDVSEQYGDSNNQYRGGPNEYQESGNSYGNVNNQYGNDNQFGQGENILGKLNSGRPDIPMHQDYPDRQNKHVGQGAGMRDSLLEMPMSQPNVPLDRGAMDPQGIQRLGLNQNPKLWHDNISQSDILRPMRPDVGIPTDIALRQNRDMQPPITQSIGLMPTPISTNAAPEQKSWKNDPILEPSVIVDYEHKPLRMKARDFIEPVQTFDYNHISKDKDYRKEMPPVDRLAELDTFSRSSGSKVIDYQNKRLTDAPLDGVSRSPYNSGFSKGDSFNDNSDRLFKRSDKSSDSFSKGFLKSKFERSDDRYPKGVSRDDRSDRQGDRSDEKRREDRSRYNRFEDTDRHRGGRSSPGRWHDDRRGGDYSRRDRSRDRSRERDFRRRDRSRDRSRDIKPERVRSKSKEPVALPKISTPLANKPLHLVMIDDLLEPPGRDVRPNKIVIIMRGIPGSGKSYLAKLIKEREVENGGSAPRILSIDDYFLQETEVEEMDPVSGKMVKKAVMKYEYDANTEETYLNSLKRAFKRTVTDGYFPFIIMDSVNDQLKSYADMWNFSRQNGFQVYICNMELDTQVCFKRNIHNRTLDDIQVIAARFYPTPAHHISLDATTLLQNAAITEVHMEDANSDDDVIMEDVQEEVTTGSLTSKWEKMDDAVQLARLDGISKPLRPSQYSLDDYLQLDDWEPVRTAKPGKKTVRWADIEERRKQEKMRAIGFVVGQTDWNRMTDPSLGSSALTQTKYIERVRRY